MSEGNRRARKGAVGLVLMAAVGIGCLAAQGCGRYDGLSDEAYQLTKSALMACQSKSEERLGKVEELIEEHRANSSLSQQELRWLDRVVKLGNDGQWAKGAAMARKMMKDQIP